MSWLSYLQWPAMVLPALGTAWIGHGMGISEDILFPVVYGAQMSFCMVIEWLRPYNPKWKTLDEETAGDVLHTFLGNTVVLELTKVAASFLHNTFQSFYDTSLGRSFLSSV